MQEITLEQLLEAGCHFGHQVTRSNPKARDFIYEARDNIQIIDLVKTKQYLEQAGIFIKSLAEKEGSSLILIGTKRQARGIVEEALGSIKPGARQYLAKQNQDQKEQDQKAGEGLFYITNRWVGGLLTNFSEVAKNFKKLKDISDRLQNEEVKTKYTKKEIGLWLREKEKLERLYGGIATLAKKPDALFIIDSHLEDLAVREARQMDVITVAIVDTNADPDVIDYPIPANDDAVGSIKLITSYIIDAWIEGRREAEKKNRESEIKNQEEKTDKKKDSGSKENKVGIKPAKKVTTKKIKIVKK